MSDHHQMVDRISSYDLGQVRTYRSHFGGHRTRSFSDPVKLLLTASLYFLAVFSVGFIIGSMRVLLLEPRLGPVAGVLCEAPFLFAAFIGAAHWSLRATRIALDARSLLLVGIIALVMQQLADFVGGAVLRGWTVSEQLTQLSTPQGAIYVLLLIIFVVMPLVVS